MTQAFIALGTNIEPRENHFIKALEMLTDHSGILIQKISSIYETDPVGYEDQEDFLNMVVEVETDLTAEELLRYCQLIEERLGRVRTIRNGPRTIDLDILLYSQESIRLVDLEIPHPRMHERAFVLVPLGEIAPEIIVPGTGESVQKLLNALSEEEKAGVRTWPQES
ncbi:2-amino-4-hydroxy-6-hydroxymethyldihydropteridine diphosphokinase [Aciduricibacillus chroicocephali]|uniref:2-amino-4-hydroxy-6-hydroxymethyldihydropteridine diphosphokinase n=1 Tax=Aciduricibacillus chroicocephali TaxID=3054939 RepID=A0ABY9KVK2_9BACI|nr:2-amino-4-hydroxy-6-hydroxymethyldihydropteridine diphosphokinase [Bacillaceae bacterium 44XB]